MSLTASEMFSGPPPPLTPMNKGNNNNNNMTTTTSTTAENQPRGLGAALASINNKQSVDDGDNRGHHQSVSLEEHVETGIGVHHDNDEVMSLQQQEPRKSTTSRPKRSSLIERSREFKEKFVQFMQDYDNEEDKFDKKSCYNDVDLNASNRFPTRQMDLRHVDQGINLMDASSARLEWREEEDARDVYEYGEDKYDDTDDNYNPIEDGNYTYGDDAYGDEDDVYAGYTQGYTATSSKEEPAIVGCGGLKETMDHEHLEVIKMERLSTTRNRGKSSCDSGTWFVFLMMALAAILLSSFALFRGGDSDSSGVSATHHSNLPPPPITPEPAMPANTSPVAAPGQGHSKGDVARRHHVLDHIIQEELIKGSHAAVLNPSHPSAKKAITWMTKYDAASMKLLDEFDFKPHDEQSDKLRKGQDIDAPSNHAMKIVDRYVEVVFYFESHPQATPETAVLP